MKKSAAYFLTLFFLFQVGCDSGPSDGPAASDYVEMARLTNVSSYQSREWSVSNPSPASLTVNWGDLLLYEVQQRGEASQTTVSFKYDGMPCHGFSIAAEANSWNSYYFTVDLELFHDTYGADITVVDEPRIDGFMNQDIQFPLQMNGFNLSIYRSAYTEDADGDGIYDFLEVNQYANPSGQYIDGEGRACIRRNTHVDPPLPMTDHGYAFLLQDNNGTLTLGAEDSDLTPLRYAGTNLIASPEYTFTTLLNQIFPSLEDAYAEFPQIGTQIHPRGSDIINAGSSHSLTLTGGANYLVNGARLPNSCVGLQHYPNERNSSDYLMNYYDRWGTYAVVATLMEFGLAWNAMHPKYDVSINDLSLKTGGPFYAAYGTNIEHNSHEKGTDVDIRLVRRNLNSTPEHPQLTIESAEYSKMNTAEMLAILIATSKTSNHEHGSALDKAWSHLSPNSEYAIKNVIFADFGLDVPSTVPSTIDESSSFYECLSYYLDEREISLSSICDGDITFRRETEYHDNHIHVSFRDPEESSPYCLTSSNFDVTSFQNNRHQY